MPRAVKSMKKIKPKIWIPPFYTAIYRLTVTRSDGTVDDLTNLADVIEIEDGVTDTIGRFMFELWNPNEIYTKVWTGMEAVKYYSDYADTASSLRFRGVIEKISYRANKIIVTGRGESVKVTKKTVTQSYSDIETSLILKDLFDTYGIDFTYTNINTSTTNLTVNWTQKPFWDCVRELCKAAGFDCYIDATLDVHYFEAGSVLNSGEAIVHDYNLMGVNEFADDITQMRNRIIVYGATQDGTQVLYTAEDSDSQSKYDIVKEEIINDGNITNETQAKERADYELAKIKDAPQVGEVTGILLATIQPGESIRLSSPTDNLPPGNYKIISYKHNVLPQYRTTVRVTNEPMRLSKVLKNMIEVGDMMRDTFINPFEMRFSHNFLFNSDEGTHNSTVIGAGVLYATVAEGFWVSPTKTAESNISEAYLVLIGETLTGATVQISADNGDNYQNIDPNQKITFSNQGKNLIVKVTFSNTDAQIDSLSVLYKT